MSRRVKNRQGKQTTYPIKDPKEIKKCIAWYEMKMNEAKTEIKKKQAYRNKMLYLVGINTAFRGEDLIQLRVCDLIKGFISIKENKTGKHQHFKINKKLFEQIQEYVTYMKLKDNEYMFKGQKKKTTFNGVTSDVVRPLNRQRAYKIMQELASGVGIIYPFGLHSLRKTFAYQYFIKNKDLVTLAKMLNHTSTDTTTRYIMLENEETEKEREGFYIG